MLRKFLSPTPLEKEKTGFYPASDPHPHIGWSYTLYSKFLRLKEQFINDYSGTTDMTQGGLCQAKRDKGSPHPWICFIICKVGINKTNLRVFHRMKHDHENKTPSERTKSLAHKWYSIHNSSFPYFLIKALILSITFYIHWPLDSSQQTIVDTTGAIIISFYWEACWHSKRSHVMSYVMYVTEPGLQPRPSVSKLKP